MALDWESRKFSPGALEVVVREACALPEYAAVPDQVRYLGSYLADPEMGTQTMLIERPYIDRHFLSEYQAYYATSLRDFPRQTTRLHVFSEPISIDSLIARLSSTEGAADRFELSEELQASYIGFIVLRPLPAAPVGRTVLRWYRNRDARTFGPQPPPHRVHILGLTLKAYGVQFHQQDRAVGACATAAVWCALAAVMRRDGGRSPTPLAITETANRSLPAGRAFPAVGGLTLEQMIGAMNAAGYSPDVIKPDGDPSIFKLQLMTYLRSGIPVVLQVRDEEAVEGHAVTVVGFRSADEEHGAPLIEYQFSGSHALRAPGMTRLYVHDDRLGPYARMVWDEEERRDDEQEFPSILQRLVLLEEAVFPGGNCQEPSSGPASDSSLNHGAAFPALRFRPGGPGFEAFDKKMRIWTAITPLYPKIRINALDLHSVAMEVWPMASMHAGGQRRELMLETSFATAGAYVASVYDRPIPSSRAAGIARQLILSRYVGVLRFNVGSSWLLDVLCDATDIHRDALPWASILAIIPAEMEAFAGLRKQISDDFPHVLVV